MNPRILQALKANRDWFLNSGVLSQPDGFWGVAERMLLANNNEALQQTLDSFPSWTQKPDGYVIEQRRADCNFQCAWYFLQMAKLFDHPRNVSVGNNLLEYLYCRSGLLSHHKRNEPYPLGCWNWSHIRWTPNVYYDDNAWCIILALDIAEEYPELDDKFQMRHYALAGAQALYQAFAANFPDEQPDFQPRWLGNLRLPHWGGLAAAALAAAWPLATQEEKDNWNRQIDAYFDYVREQLDTWNCSELCYSLLAVAHCHRLPNFNDRLLPLAHSLAARIVARMAPGSCLLPAEHYEAPSGTQLVDLIYTMNFAVVAFSQFTRLPGGKNYRQLLLDIVEFLVDIQDTADSPQLKGCWRGMFDLTTRQWGGGNHYEGGADSIYTGWTNAPIGWSLAQLLLDQEASQKWIC
jgi:hypothetical protein